jgi:hypothetical protein
LEFDPDIGRILRIVVGCVYTTTAESRDFVH